MMTGDRRVSHVGLTSYSFAVGEGALSARLRPSAMGESAGVAMVCLQVDLDQSAPGALHTLFVTMTEEQLETLGHMVDHYLRVQQDVQTERASERV